MLVTADNQSPFGWCSYNYEGLARVEINEVAAGEILAITVLKTSTSATP